MVNWAFGIWMYMVGYHHHPLQEHVFFPQIDCSDVYFQLINQLYHPHRSMGYSPQIAIWIGEMMIIHWIWGWLPNFQTKPHGFSQFLKAAPSCRKPLRSLGVPTALCSPNTHTSRSQRICHRIQPCSNDPDAWLDWLDLQRPLGILCHVFHRNISNLGQFSHPPKVDKLETWKALVNMCHLSQLSASPMGGFWISGCSLPVWEPTKSTSAMEITAWSFSVLQYKRVLGLKRELLGKSQLFLLSVGVFGDFKLITVFCFLDFKVLPSLLAGKDCITKMLTQGICRSFVAISHPTQDQFRHFNLFLVTMGLSG